MPDDSNTLLVLPATPGTDTGATAPTAEAASAALLAEPLPADASAAPALSPEEVAAAEAAAAEAARLEAEAAAAAEREARLKRLLDRISEHPDFPSLKDSIRSIQSLARSETAHMRAFSDQILQDVAMSSKLLRLINTAFYSSAGGGEITSIERAIALMGFKSVGTLASSIKLFDRLPKGGPYLDRVKQQFARGLLAGMLSSELRGGGQRDEIGYTASVFQQLGEMLTWMHFPDDAATITERVASTVQAAEHSSPDAPAPTPAEHLQLLDQCSTRISREVLSLSYEELGHEIARMWGWPDALLQAMRPLRPAATDRPATDGEYLRLLCTASNELAHTLMDVPPEERANHLPAFLQTWGVPLGLEQEQIEPVLTRAFDDWQQLAISLGVIKPPPPPVRAPAKSAAAAAGAAAKSASAQKPGQPGAAQKPGTTGAPPAARPRPAHPPAVPRPQATPILSRGIEQVSEAAMGEMPLPQVMQMTLQILREALHLRRAIVCLRDASGQMLQGRLGVGEQGQSLAPTFRVTLAGQPDLFGMLCLRSADTLIQDTSDPLIARHLPAWFHQNVQAPTFLVLPLVHAGGGNPRVLGMLYGDRAEVASLAVDEQQLGMLKTLRNQVLLAMRLRSGG